MVDPVLEIRCVLHAQQQIESYRQRTIPICSTITFLNHQSTGNSIREMELGTIKMFMHWYICDMHHNVINILRKYYQHDNIWSRNLINNLLNYFTYILISTSLQNKNYA